MAVLHTDLGSKKNLIEGEDEKKSSECRNLRSGIQGMTDDHVKGLEQKHSAVNICAADCQLSLLFSLL